MNIKAKIIRTVTDRPVLRAVCDVILDDSMVIHHVLLAENGDKSFVFMPYQTWTDEAGKTKYFDIVDLLTEEIKEQILRAVTEAYDSAMEKESKDERRDEND